MKKICLFFCLLLLIFASAVNAQHLWVESPWKKIGTDVTLAVPTNEVGINKSSPDGQLHIVPKDATTTSLIVQGAPAQSVPISIFKDSNDVAGITIGSGFDITLATGVDLDVGGVLSVGTLTLSSGSVTDGSGAISFGNENLTTTGTFQAEDLSSTDDADITDQLTVGNLVIDEAAGTLDFTGATSATITSSGSGLIQFGNDALQLGSTTVDGSTITIIKGAQVGDPQIQFSLSDDGVGGFTIATSGGTDGDIYLDPSGNAVHFGADDNGVDLDIHSAGVINIRDASDDTVVVIGPVANGTTTLGVTGALDVSGQIDAGTLAINSGSITDSSGAISFGDENLTTSGIINAGTFDTNVAAAGATLSGTTLGTDGTDVQIPFTIDLKGTGISTYLEIINDNNTGVMALGRTDGTESSMLSIVDGGADNEPGFLQLYTDGGTGIYHWASSGNQLRIANSLPADDDAGGYAIIDSDDGSIGSILQTIYASDVQITADDAVTTPLVVKAAAAQSVPLSIIKDSADVALVTTGSAGDITLATGVDLDVGGVLYTGPQNYGTNPGVVSAGTCSIDANSIDGTVHGFILDPGGMETFRVSRESDGAGSSDTPLVTITGRVKYTERGDTYLFIDSNEVADDGLMALPAVTHCATGRIIIGNDEYYADFTIDNDGDVRIVSSSPYGAIVAGADTDSKICLGTAAAQEPVQVKNRLGFAKNIFVRIEYD